MDHAERAGTDDHCVAGSGDWGSGVNTMNPGQSYAYWATVDLYRTFLFEDGPLLETIIDAGGRLDGLTLSRIAQSYSVARTIPAAPDDDPTFNVDIFAREVIALSDAWPKDTIERAAACRKTADKLVSLFRRTAKAAREGETPVTPRKTGSPHSAVTKLIWFLKPDGWTVYDRYAADAVLAGPDKNGGERQQRFYDAIAEPLATYAEPLRGPLAELNPRLHAERLIDKYLVLKGFSEASYTGAQVKNRHFLRLAPESLAKSIERTARVVQPLLPDDAFPKQRRTRKKKAA
jgi:hypothetical protein